MQEANGKFRIDLRQKCRQFSISIIKFCEGLPQKRASWIIADQIIRSATSIGANIVEARGSSSRQEFKRFYEIALKSSNETLYWLELLRDLDSGAEKTIKSLVDEALEINKMVAGGVIKLKGPKL